MICRCGHSRTAHDDPELRPQCTARVCTCVLYRPVGGVATAPLRQSVEADTRLRRCRTCEKARPLGDFYVKGDGNVQPVCKDCDNARPRNVTLTRIVRVRARHRAVAALIKAHGPEFRNLLNHFTDVVSEEAAALAEAFATAEAEHEHDHPANDAEPSLPRLKSGPRREGQTLVERLDVARCPECVGYHDRGHRCAQCGAEPEQAATA